jgi:hypothetical protein
MQSVPLGTRLYMDLPASLTFLGAGIPPPRPWRLAPSSRSMLPRRPVWILVITHALRTDVTGTMAAALTRVLGPPILGRRRNLGVSLERVFPGE